MKPHQAAKERYMQFKDSTGGSHPSQMQAYQASQKTPQADGDTTQSKDITQDAQAMHLVDQLKQMGYTADDVAQAFDAGDQSQAPSGASATAAAPLQIPGA